MSRLPRSDLFVGAGEAGMTANVPDELAQLIGGKSRGHLINALKRLDKQLGTRSSTAGMTKAQLVNRVLSRMTSLTTTQGVPQGGGDVVEDVPRSSAKYVRQVRGASRTPLLESAPPVAETGLARRGGALARRGDLISLGGDADPDVIDAVFREMRGGKGVGGAAGPFYAGPATRRALPMAAEAAAAEGAGAAGALGKAIGAGGKVAKGLGRFLGPAAVALSVADIVMRVLDASQGNIDRQRLHRGEIANDVLGNLDVGTQELEAKNQGRAIRSMGNVGQGLEIASALRAPEEEANSLEDILTRRKAELAGVGVRAQPGEDEYLLAMRRFM